MTDMKLKDFIAKFEEVIPLRLQDSWDRSGLQWGDPEQELSKILVSFDVCHEVIQYAKENHCNLIITHHPYRLESHKQFDFTRYDDQTLQRAIKADIAVYTAHTSHDNSLLSLSRHMIKELGANILRPLLPHDERLFKVIVFAERSNIEKIKQSAFMAGAGHIGNYKECAFYSEGWGCFTGDAHTTPTIGQPLQPTLTPESKLEFICPERVLSQVMQAIRTHHTYEEPAIDIIPLANKISPSQSHTGSGAIGEFATELSFKDLSTLVQKTFKAPWMKLVHSHPRLNKKIAIVTGSGASFLHQAHQCAVDTFITGDIKYHQAIEAKRLGVNLIDVGHFYSEIAVVDELTKIIQSLGTQLDILSYDLLTDPFELMRDFD